VFLLSEKTKTKKYEKRNKKSGPYSPIRRRTTMASPYLETITFLATVGFGISHCRNANN